MKEQRRDEVGSCHDVKSCEENFFGKVVAQIFFRDRFLLDFFVTQPYTTGRPKIGLSPLERYEQSIQRRRRGRIRG